MKTSKTVVLVAALCGLSALSLSAQQRPEAGGEGRPDAPRRPAPPFMVALDLNGDGVLSPEEIQRAPESLLKLDKNGDGQLTIDELRPPPPQRNRFGGDENRPRRSRENRESDRRPDREQERPRPERRDSRPQN